MSLTDPGLHSAEVPADELEDEDPEHIDVNADDLGEDDGGEEPTAAEDETDGVTITFGDDAIEDDSDNSVIRQLRQQLKDESKRRRELEAKVPKVEAGPRPKLEDFDWDEDKHAEALETWVATKREAETQAAQASPDTAARADFDRDFGVYQTQKTTLARPDFEAVESVVTNTLDMQQQVALVSVAKNKAALVYALGKSPERLNTLAAITNPFKFATAVADIERSLKVQPRKTAPAPEPRQRGGTPANPDTRKRAENNILDKASEGGDVTEQLRKLRAMRNK